MSCGGSPHSPSAQDPLFPNTEIVEDLVEEVVDEGFAEDAAEVLEGDVEVAVHETPDQCLDHISLASLLLRRLNDTR